MPSFVIKGPSSLAICVVCLNVRPGQGASLVSKQCAACEALAVVLPLTVDGW